MAAAEGQDGAGFGSGPDAGSGPIDAAAVRVRFSPPAAPINTWMTARSTAMSTTDQNSLDSETSLPHSRTTTPRTPTTTRSQRALDATHRPVPAAGVSASAEPTDSRPPATIARAAAPVLLRPANQPTTTRVKPSQSSTC